MSIQFTLVAKKLREKPMHDELTPTIQTSNSVPSWIFYFGCFLATIGIVAGLLGVISPTKFFSDFPDFTQWAEIAYVTTGWGIRSLTMGLAMLLALWTKSPGAIGVIFSMRFLTETGDLLNTLTTGHGSMGMPLIIVAAVWVIVFLLPEALAVRWAINRMRTMKG